MNIKKELLEIPPALRQMLEEGRPQYDALVRRVSWTERPVFVIGDGSSYPAALSGASAFESLLGVPAIARRPADFSAYTLPAITARSLVMVISGSGDPEGALQAARKVKHRGAIVWAVSADPASELAKLADATVNCFPGESAAEGVQSAFCQHAAMLFLAVAAGHLLKGPARHLTELGEELEKLPKHVEWVFNQIPDAARAFATELRALTKVFVVGGGPFHPVALQAADQLEKLAGLDVRGWELLHFQNAFHHPPQPGEGILYLSSSRCGLKAQVHQSIRENRHKAGQRIFAVTDGNDRQLSERATLAVLLPVLTEPAAALLTLAFLDFITHYAAQAPQRGSGRSH